MFSILFEIANIQMFCSVYTPSCFLNPVLNFIELHFDLKFWTKFVAIIWDLLVFIMQFFAWPIFRLTHLTFRPQKRDKQVVPSGH